MNRWLAALALLLLATVPSLAAETRPYRATRFITVNGVTLNYVDWGGKGETLLFLHGMGGDAYVFDSFARHFTDRFRVLGLTRRGCGMSEKPKGGYDTATRVEDIRALLDALKISRVNLAGHSLAGDELTLFATRYPDRVLKLVYLDAAYDRYHMASLELSDPSIPPVGKRLVLEALGDARAQQVAVERLPPLDVWRVLVATKKAANEFHPDYRRIQAPALAIYATSPPASFKARQRASIDQFKREARRGEIVELPNATHFVFGGATGAQVVRLVRAFLFR